MSPRRTRFCTGQEKEVLADAGYIGVEKRPEVAQRYPGVRWSVARQRGQVKALPESQYKPLIVGIEKCKAQLRAYVEHPFHIVKNLFGYRKVRYRGLAENTAQLHTLFALANLMIAKRALLRQAQGRDAIRSQKPSQTTHRKPKELSLSHPQSQPRRPAESV